MSDRLETPVGQDSAAVVRFDDVSGLSIDKYHLPNLDLRPYRKTTTTLMARVDCGDGAIVHTSEGPINMTGLCWIAIDEEGHPYPISVDIQAATYARA
jgi:hypothetical protein